MSCYYVAADLPRYIRNRHDEGCPTTTWHAPLAAIECDGCEVCERRHCLIQWHGDRGDCATHAESVCPACVGKMREHLTEIVRLSGLPLLEQVLRTGRPDTEAADLLGPAADPAQWSQRIAYGHVHDPEASLGGHNPLWVLGRLDMEVTEHLGHKRSQRVTIPAAARYLDANLTWLAADPSFGIVEMASDLADCRKHLERALHDGAQIETGAPCMTCHVEMRRIWRGEDLPWSHRDGSHPIADTDGWTCSRCREFRADQEYRLNVRNLHQDNADWLTCAAIEVRTGIRAGTVREWARRIESAYRTREPLVRKRRRDGRTEYAVADVERVAREKGMLTA